MKHALKILDTSLFDLCYNSNFGPVLSDEEEAERAEIEVVENDNANATDDEETDVLLDSVARTENDPTLDNDESRGVACVIQGGAQAPPPGRFWARRAPPLARRKNERGDPFLMKNWWKTLSKFKIFGASRHFQKGSPLSFSIFDTKNFSKFLTKGSPLISKNFWKVGPPLADFVRYAPGWILLKMILNFLFFVLSKFVLHLFPGVDLFSEIFLINSVFFQLGSGSGSGWKCGIRIRNRVGGSGYG